MGIGDFGGGIWVAFGGGSRALPPLVEFLFSFSPFLF
jgi:hypothetical protein